MRIVAFVTGEGGLQGSTCLFDCPGKLLMGVHLTGFS